MPDFACPACAPPNFEIMGGSLNLRGRSGKFIDSAGANLILARARVRFAPSAGMAKASLQRVVGRAEMPDPRTMSLRQWRAIPSANLRLEREIEQYIVDPLLRFCGIPRRTLTATRQMRTKDGIPDYVIATPERTLAVVEVKPRVAAPRSPPRLLDPAPIESSLSRTPDILAFQGWGRACPKRTRSVNDRVWAAAQIKCDRQRIW